MQIPGFRQNITDGWYQVRISGRDIHPGEVTARLHDPLPPGAVIHIVPRAAGAKSGWGGILAGAALIAASFIPGLGVVAAGALLSLGASMALGGVSQLLAPKPDTPGNNTTDNGKQSTYFSSLDNMTAQGNPVPVPYGEVMVGSRRISQTLGTRDESSPERTLDFGGHRGRDLIGDVARHIQGKFQGVLRPRVIVR